MTTQTEFENKPEIKALPEAVQRKLVSFIYTEIPKMPFFKPDGKPKKEWKIFYGDTWDAAYDAASGAAWDAAYDAARGAAYGAAYDAGYDAAYDAARGAAYDAASGAAYDAAYDAARGAAYDAARGAAYGAAYDAGYDAASDAALMSDYLMTSDLKFKDKAKHLKHVLARWEVWQKGYGLFCDVDGVLYMYAAKSKSPETDKDKIVALEKQVAELKGKIEKAKAVLA
jgi:hypothetical protein